MPTNYKERYEDLVNVINTTIAFSEANLFGDNRGINKLMDMQNESNIRCLNMVLDIHKLGKGINYQ